MKYKKQRGQHRKFKALCNNINQICYFQNVDCPYEHFHVPSDPFISSSKTSGKIKTAFCEAWLAKTVEIIEHKPCNLPFCKVVAVIDERNLWNSQIIIFYDENYYDSFWLRDSVEQTWTPFVKQDKSFIKERHIESNLKEKGYYETITDLDFTYKTVLWFYGEVK